MTYILKAINPSAKIYAMFGDLRKSYTHNYNKVCLDDGTVVEKIKKNKTVCPDMVWGLIDGTWYYFNIAFLKEVK